MTQPLDSVATAPVAPSHEWRAARVVTVLTRLGAPVIVLIALVTLYVTSTQADHNVFVYNTFLLMCIGSLALSLLMGTTGQVSAGSAGFLAAGAFSAVWFDRSGMPFVVCALGGALVAAVLGLIVALPAIRLRGLALGLGTIAAHYVIVFVVDKYQQDTPDAGPAGFSLPAVFGLTGTNTQSKWAWLLCGVVTVVILAVSRLASGRTGRALRLIRDQEAIAGTQAVPVTAYKMLAFGASSFLLGLQGALTAYVAGQVSSEQFTLILAIQFLAMVLVGGLDSVFGAVLGAAIFTALPFVMQDAVSAVLGANQASLNGARYAVIVYALLVVVFIVAAPAGLAGLIRRAAGRARTVAERRLRRTVSGQ
ncbi:branched-chain amino acid ABC transporter permease [Dactylosporangium sp. NPDC000555]|uniref:branched-chain amino acid ABC transporter permease n=1 Tax=Dactylosporangium sp. NPDC000555 TaxID=3154260 RepID=UPI003319C262